MQYLLLIYADEAGKPPPPTDPTEFKAWMAPWVDYEAELRAAKVYVAGEALQPVATATTITAVGASEPVLTDGPFAETREQLGGFYMLDCKDLDEALKWGAKCPIVHFGKLEVRPIMTFG